jgi:hypothetical protein
MPERLEFIGPVQPAQDGGITYMAIVDGEEVNCHFTWLALCAVDNQQQPASAKMLFENSKGKLLAIAEKKIREGKIEDRLVWIDREDV